MYSEVTEEEYARLVQERRLQGDFVEDDGEDLGYQDDGEDHWQEYQAEEHKDNPKLRPGTQHTTPHHTTPHHTTPHHTTPHTMHHAPCTPPHGITTCDMLAHRFPFLPLSLLCAHSPRCPRDRA